MAEVEFKRLTESQVHALSVKIWDTGRGSVRIHHSRAYLLESQHIIPVIIPTMVTVLIRAETTLPKTILHILVTVNLVVFRHQEASLVTTMTILFKLLLLLLLPRLLGANTEDQLRLQEITEMLLRLQGGITMTTE